MSKIFDLWNTVAGAFGPSGREDAVRETIAEIAGAYIDDVTTDALGNLICRKKGAKNGKKLLFAAHMDSIGVVATYIEDKGFIRFSQIGGLYVGDLLNIQVKFANGTRGVISYEEKTPLKDLTLDNLFIDIGAKNAEEARKLVQIGDFAVYEAPRFEQNGVLCGPYLDNRIGCVTLLLMMEQLADKEIENDLYFVFTAQEEVGLRGAGAAAFAVEPDAAIAVDVTDTGDLPEMKSAMAVELGKGPAVKVMDRSVICTPAVVDALERAQQALGGRHHLHTHKRRVALSRGRDRRLLPQGRGLVDVRAHHRETRGGCARAGGERLRCIRAARNPAVRRHGYFGAAEGARRRAGRRGLHPDSLYPFSE